jgi:acyl-CoA reductase-like NAD-dependent aldehyde dehydrogenase
MRADRLARRLEAGMAFVNNYTSSSARRTSASRPAAAPCRAGRPGILKKNITARARV